MPTINLDEATKELKKAIDALANCENDDAEIKLKLQEITVYAQHRLGEFAADAASEEDDEEDEEEEEEEEDEECDECGEFVDDCVCDEEDEDDDEEED